MHNIANTQEYLTNFMEIKKSRQIAQNNSKKQLEQKNKSKNKFNNKSNISDIVTQ